MTAQFLYPHGVSIAPGELGEELLRQTKSPSVRRGFVDRGLPEGLEGEFWQGICRVLLNRSLNSPGSWSNEAITYSVDAGDPERFSGIVAKLVAQALNIFLDQPVAIDLVSP